MCLIYTKLEILNFLGQSLLLSSRELFDLARNFLLVQNPEFHNCKPTTQFHSETAETSMYLHIVIYKICINVILTCMSRFSNQNFICISCLLHIEFYS